MKRKILLVLLSLVMCALSLTACGIGSRKEMEENQTAYEKTQKMLNEMTSYKSIATVEYISNKGSNVYETLHRCKISGEYRVEVIEPDNVAGSITLSDTKTIYQFNPKISGKIAMSTKENQERSEIFVTSFIKNYQVSQEVSISVANLEQGKCTVLEAAIPGGHPYLSTEKLWVDNETIQPVKLVLYDPDGSERVVVTFKSFEYNVELEESLFKVGEQEAPAAEQREIK